LKEKHENFSHFTRWSRIGGVGINRIEEDYEEKFFKLVDYT